MTKSAFSLRTKLQTLDVGDIILFPDDIPARPADHGISA